MLVHHYVEYYARNNPERPCVTQAASSWSYQKMDQCSNQLANGLLSLGVSRGQRIAILGENSPEHYLMFLAASKIGAVAVPLNYRLAPAEVAYIINDAEAKMMLVLEGMETTLEAMRDSLPTDLTVVTQAASHDLHWQAWLNDFDTVLSSQSVDKNDAFIQLYTSGTTGNPKGVEISHFNILSLSHMNQIGMPNRPNAGSAGIVCAPLFHIGGAGSVISGMTGGQNALLHKAFEPAPLLDDLEKYPVSSLFMVPAMIMALLQMPGIEKRDFSQLKQIFYGASPISETLLRKAIEIFKCDFTQMYGMTETTGTVVSLSPDDHRAALDGRPELLRSCGRPSVGVQIKAVGKDGEQKPVGEIGEIWVKSDTNMLAYYNLPEATAKEFTDGWVHTGDAGFIDDDGYLFLKDRVKDMVVSGGENIYPVEVENAIAKHEAVVDVAVIGVPNDRFGEALLAFCVLQPGASLSADELLEFCRDKLAGYKIPRQLELIDELPRNASGKVLKTVLRGPYWEGKDRAIG